MPVPSLPARAWPLASLDLPVTLPVCSCLFAPARVSLLVARPVFAKLILGFVHIPFFGFSLALPLMFKFV